MHIVQFIDTLRCGGKERQLVELLKGLSAVPEITCDLIIMSPNIHYSYLDNLGIKTYFLIRKSRKDPGIFFHLYCLLKQIQPDILHSWDSMCSVYSVPVVKMLGIKFVNGFLRNAPPRISMQSNCWLRSKFTFPFSHAIVANSRAGLNAYHVPQQKSFCIHNGFDLSRVSNLPNQREVQAMLNIQTDKVVGMVASFSDNKDYPTLLEAAQSIIAQRDDVTFVTVGDGKNLEPLLRQIPSSLHDRIKFLGRQEDIEVIVNVFTIGVLVSNAKVHGEGISNSIMEYMVLGKPVIATDCGGNRELIDDGETGFLVKPGDVGELVGKILMLLDDSELAKRFGKQGHMRIVNEFSLEKMSREYIELYQLLLRP